MYNISHVKKKRILQLQRGPIFFWAELLPNAKTHIYIFSRPNPPNWRFFGMQISVDRFYDRRPNDLYDTL